MDGIAIKSSVDINTEPQSLPAGSVEPCPVLPDPAQLTDRAPIGAQRLALTIVTTIAVVFALQWAEKFFIPLLLGIIIAYTLNPFLVWLERVKIPRVPGTIIVMLAVLCGSAFVTISMREQVQTILDQVPEAASKLAISIRSMRGGRPSTMQKVQAAAQEIDKATSQAADIPSTPKQPATLVIIDQPTFKLGDYLKAGSMGVFGFISQATMVLLLVFFLLLAGDSFKRKLVRVTGLSLSDKKITVHILDDINVSIQRDMFTLLVANALLALLTWGTFWWIGLENAGGWAIAAGVLHIIPYLGPALIAIARGMVGFMQFEFVLYGLVGVRQLASDLHPCWHIRHDLDDRENGENECGSSLYRAALLGMALGSSRSAARDSHPGHCECDLSACRSTQAPG